MTDEDQVARATNIRPSDARESRREHYETLRKWNSYQDDQVEEREQDALNVVDAVASSLELTDLQKERARNYLQKLDSDYRRAYPIELIAICLCSLAGHVDGRDYHPNVLNPGCRTHNEFVVFVREAGFSYKRVYSCWSALKSEVM